MERKPAYTVHFDGRREPVPADTLREAIRTAELRRRVAEIKFYGALTATWTPERGCELVPIPEILVRPRNTARAAASLSRASGKLITVSQGLFHALSEFALGVDKLSMETQAIAENARRFARLSRVSMPPGLEHF